MTRGRTKPLFTPVQRNTLTVPGMPGGHLSSTEIEPISFIQPIAYIAKDDNHALQIKDELAEWLITDKPAPLQFDDEPGRTYYAIVQNTIEDFERIAVLRQGAINFLCLDPFSYGKEQTKSFTSDILTLPYKGTAPASPIFELEVLKPSTFAMVQNGLGEYMMIGNLDEDTEEVINDRTLLFSENGSTMDTWKTNPVRIDPWIGDITGKFSTGESDGSGIIVADYGTGDKIHGPAAIKEIPPTQDFEISANIDIVSTKPDNNFRYEIYMFDENMDMLGKIGINDNNRHLQQRIGLGRVGEYVDSNTRYVIAKGNYNKTNLGGTTLMYLNVKREGRKYTFFIGERRYGKLYATIKETYTDNSGEWMGKLKYVQVFMGVWQDRLRPLIGKFVNIDVYKLADKTVGATPNIVYPGDLITFDNHNKKIRINGEDAKNQKAMGASFFKLRKGDNQLVVHPSNTFKASAKWRNRYR